MYCADWVNITVDYVMERLGQMVLERRPITRFNGETGTIAERTVSMLERGMKPDRFVLLFENGATLILAQLPYSPASTKNGNVTNQI